MAVFCIILGIIVFLLMEHALVLWLVFVPLVLIFVVSLIKFFTNGRSGIGDFVTSMVVLVLMLVALMVVCIP